MARLRFQNRDVIYEIVSVFNFKSVGRRVQKTYYSEIHGLSREEVLKAAKERIERKLEETEGELISIEIKNVYF